MLNQPKQESLSQVIKSLGNNVTKLSNATFLIKHRNPAIKYSRTQYIVEIPAVRTVYLSKESFYQLKTLLSSLNVSVKYVTELEKEVTQLRKDRATHLEQLQLLETKENRSKECLEVKDIITSKLKEMLTLQAKLNQAQVDQNWLLVSNYAQTLDNGYKEVEMWEEYIAAISE